MDKQNGFVYIVGAFEVSSLAAFLNEVILYKKRHRVSEHCSSHHGTNHEIA